MSSLPAGGPGEIGLSSMPSSRAWTTRAGPILAGRDSFGRTSRRRTSPLSSTRLGEPPLHRSSGGAAGRHRDDRPIRSAMSAEPLPLELPEPLGIAEAEVRLGYDIHPRMAGFLVVVATAVGAVVRIAPFGGNPFPLNEGG